MTQSTERQLQTLSDKIRGKVIKSVTIPKTKDRFDMTHHVDNDAGDIAIVFEDGSQLIAWNSEWGGIGFIDK